MPATSFTKSMKKFGYGEIEIYSERVETLREKKNNKIYKHLVNKM